jgi:hypothetical protein
MAMLEQDGHLALQRPAVHLVVWLVVRQDLDKDDRSNCRGLHRLWEVVAGKALSI